MFFSLEKHRAYLGFYMIIGNDIHSFNVEILPIYYSNSEINEDYIWIIYTNKYICTCMYIIYVDVVIYLYLYLHLYLST